MDFSERLYNLRKQKNLSQKELAQKLGVAQASINYWEKAQRTPSIDMVALIADFFNVSIDYLMGLDDKEESLCSLTTFQDELDDYLQELGEFLYYNPSHKSLFDACRNIKESDVSFATEMLNRISGKGSDN